MSKRKKIRGDLRWIAYIKAACAIRDVVDRGDFRLSDAMEASPTDRRDVTLFMERIADKLLVKSDRVK